MLGHLINTVSSIVTNNEEKHDDSCMIGSALVSVLKSKLWGGITTTLIEVEELIIPPDGVKWKFDGVLDGKLTLK